MRTSRSSRRCTAVPTSDCAPEPVHELPRRYGCERHSLAAGVGLAPRTSAALGRSPGEECHAFQLRH